MRWTTGWYGPTSHNRQPKHATPLPGIYTTWTIGWPTEHVHTAHTPDTALATIGHCAAHRPQLRRALETVRAHNWTDLTRWPGSYLTLARHRSTIAVITDLAGQHPVYWRTLNRGTWWSTSASALANLDGAPTAPVALAPHLPLGQPDILSHHSLFRTVHRVPPGHLLLLTPDGPTVHRYEPTEYQPTPLAEAAPTVRAALSEAVEARLGDQPVSSDLAGLDSTTLACLAARRTPVLGTTFADTRLHDDDLSYATRTAAAVRHLDHRPIRGHRHTIYYAALQSPTDLPLTDSPNAFAVTATIKREVLNTISKEQPGSLHFTGAAGDGVLSASDAYLTDMLRSHRYGTAARRLQQHARLRRTSAAAMLRRAHPASRTTLAAEWRHTAHALHHPAPEWTPHDQQPISWTPLLPTAGWMSPDVREQLAAALTHAAETPPEVRHLAAWTERQDLIRVGTDTTGLRDLAAQHGIDLAAPYLDNEVIRACLTVPAEQRGHPGTFKPLLNHAFGHTGTVPSFVLCRVTKGGFNALSYAGLRTHAQTLRTLLGPDSRLATAGLITPDPVNDMLARAAAGQPTAQGAIHLATVTELWLRQHETTPDHWEVPADAVAA